VAGLSIAGLTACGSLGVDVIPIPEGSEVFVLEPTLLNYHFVDTSGAARLELTWLPTEPYAGYTCLALKPTTPTDTTGSFVHAVVGQNVGRQLRNNNGFVDTTAAIFLSGQEGTHGTFVVNSAGVLKLNWADGGAARSFFDPSAVIRLSGDTIASDVQRSASGDSVTVEWHVRWLRGTC
jgi:hypothetical protein